MPDINTDKVCYVIVKARELASQVDASNPSDDNSTSALTEDADASIRAELTEYIDAMDEDEQCDLVALAWVGRGDYTAEEWKTAVEEAHARRERTASAYLLENPLLASHLENGLAEFGESCDGFVGDGQ